VHVAVGIPQAVGDHGSTSWPLPIR
jgi:hypothetical protein